MVINSNPVMLYKLIFWMNINYFLFAGAQHVFFHLDTAVLSRCWTQMSAEEGQATTGLTAAYRWLRQDDSAEMLLVRDDRSYKLQLKRLKLYWMLLPQVGSAGVKQSQKPPSGRILQIQLFPALHVLLGIPVAGEMLRPWDLKLLHLIANVFENQGFFSSMAWSTLALPLLFA